MKDELQKLINAERKYKRELKELRDLKAKHAKMKSPDAKIMQMIDFEIQNYLEPK